MFEQQGTKGAFGDNPKVMFFLGLFVGISSITTLVLALILGALLTGKTLPLLNPGSGNAQVAVAAQPTADPIIPDEIPALPVKEVDASVDNIKGATNAKVTLIEYSDFECPFCARHNTSMDQVMLDFPNDVRLVYRHFPLSFHAEAQKAAEASECAAKQGKFWEMHDKIFAANESGTMSEDEWKKAARAMGMDGSKFDNCLDSGETAAKVMQDLQEGSAAGVGGTPATFINGQLVEGAVPYETLKAIIESEINL
ncbi:MAG: DsbA family protein [Patescibacteria group bacterium]|nr:DsbA family protein [Patescibacteria group bacterium]MBU2509315.1 DsbA family protein [Patescibacteria group bacterium]